MKNLVNFSILISLALISPIWSGPIGKGDPEVTMKPEEIIQRWGYQAEVYEVTTDDGYILPLYRIPGAGQQNETTNDPRPVVFLQHGLENSAADWMLNLPQQSAPFIFSDAGFDVWIGNFRGNAYAKRHVTLSPKSHKFWEFSWDEMARYDLPVSINKALEISGASQIYYIAHSMGTMTGFAQFSQNPTLAKKIKQFYALAPILSLKHVQGPVKYAAPFTKSMKLITSIFGVDEFLPNGKLQQLWAKYVCPNPLTDLLCKNVLLMISGPNTHQINESRIPVINAHSPAGTSVQTIIHFGQLINSGNFQAYDYGSAKANKQHYGTSTPPIYDVSKLETPIIVYSSPSDYLADQTDVASLIHQFKNVVDSVYVPDFNHMDFAWGVRAAPQIYQPIVQSINKDFRA